LTVLKNTARVKRASKNTRKDVANVRSMLARPQLCEGRRIGIAIVEAVMFCSFSAFIFRGAHSGKNHERPGQCPPPLPHPLLGIEVKPQGGRVLRGSQKRGGTGNGGMQDAQGACKSEVAQDMVECRMRKGNLDLY